MNALHFHSLPSQRQRSRAGVTLTELLVVLVIISILSTLALPVYITHAEKARVATAQTEVKQLGDGQETVAAIHGYYVPLQLLDDLAGGSASGVGLSADSDAIENESASIKLIDPSASLLNLNTQDDLGDANTNQRVRNIVQRWEGPFMNPQRVYIGDASAPDPLLLDGNLERMDHPLDPWGNPYRFYSPLGLIGSGASSTDPNSYRNQSFSDGTVTSTDDRFDRFAIVSYGPDGVSNPSGGGNYDDIFYFFGRVNLLRNETDYAPIPNPTTP